MIFSTITGNLGRDSELRETKAGPVLSFSVASEDRAGSEKATTWVRCSMFGKRGVALAQHLIKGTRVVVFGPIRLREYNGKTSLECIANEIVLMGGGRQQGSENNAPTQQAPQSGGGYSETDYPNDVSDDFPF
jgi:single-strand DNA-binding protein